MIWSTPESLADDSAALSVTAPTVLADTGTTISKTGPQFFKNSDGVTWTGCFVYYPRYNADQQIVTVDLSTGLVGVSDTTVFENESWHQFVAVPGPGNKSYINPKGGSPLHIRIHCYDTGTHTWQYNVAGTRSDHLGSAQPSKIAVGTNGRIYSLGKTPEDKLSVLEVDPNNDHATRFYTDIDANGDVVSVAADDQYIYVIDDPYGTRTLTAINLADNARTTIYSGAGIVLHQRKYGVILNHSTTYRYVYHGAVSGGFSNSAINDDPPWGFDDTDLLAYSSVYAVNPPFSSFDDTATIPVEGTTGRFWFNDPRYPGDQKTSVDIPGVVKYAQSLKTVKVVSDQKVLFGATDYNGYSLFDRQTNAVSTLKPASGTLSNYTISAKNGIAYISGYFGAPVLRYDTNQAWTNAITYDYDPNQAQDFDNPEYLGAIGNAHNIGKAFSSAIGADGKAYFCGEKVRSGDGGGVAVYDPITDTVSGYTDEFEDENPRNAVSCGKFIVVSSYYDVTPHPIRLNVIDTELSDVVRTIEPADDIENNAGRLAADNSGNVYVYTENDAQTETRIIKVNVQTGVVIWDRAYPIVSLVGGYNDDGTADIKYASDGFLYATMSGSKWLIRINPANGDVAPLMRFASNIGRFDLYNNTIYFAGSTQIRSVSGFLADIDMANYPWPAKLSGRNVIGARCNFRNIVALAFGGQTYSLVPLAESALIAGAGIVEVSAPTLIPGAGVVALN